MSLPDIFSPPPQLARRADGPRSTEAQASIEVELATCLAATGVPDPGKALAAALKPSLDCPLPRFRPAVGIATGTDAAKAAEAATSTSPAPAGAVQSESTRAAQDADAATKSEASQQQETQEKAAEKGR